MNGNSGTFLKNLSLETGFQNAKLPLCIKFYNKIKNQSQNCPMFSQMIKFCPSLHGIPLKNTLGTKTGNATREEQYFSLFSSDDFIQDTKRSWCHHCEALWRRYGNIYIQ
jgi:hypothetical protein